MNSFALFLRQLLALCHKNVLVLTRHPILNLARCIIAPIAFSVFMAYARLFFQQTQDLGIGDPVPIYDLTSTIGDSLLPWTIDNNDTSPDLEAAQNIMDRISVDLTSHQSSNVQYFETIESIYNACPQNFQGRSECFAAVQWVSTSPENYSYILRADEGLVTIDVTGHSSDFEKRLLPLQWAIESAIIQESTGTIPAQPLQWPYTITTNEEQTIDQRLGYVRTISDLLSLALFVGLLGVVYHIAGEVATERATLLTAHLDVMGCLKSSRIISWLVSLGGIYTFAYLFMGIVYHFLVFTESNVGLMIVFHILTGLSLASYTLFVATPFSSNPQLAAIVSTALAIIFAIIALVVKVERVSTVIVLSIIFPPSQYIFGLLIFSEWERDLLAVDAVSTHRNANVPLLAIFIIQIIDIILFPLLASLIEKFMFDGRTKKNNKKQREQHESDQQRLQSSNIAISLNNIKKLYNTGRNWATCGIRKHNLVTAVESLSFDVKLGDVFCLLGNNGSGKSTTLQMIAGLVQETSGSIFCNDQIKQSTFGIAPQKNVLWPDLTCKQHLNLWRDIKSLEASSSEDVLDLLARCDLSHKVDSKAGDMSGGMKRKLQLACAIVGGSKCLLLDEITSGLDPLSRRAIWKIINSNRGQRTIIYCTHFLDEADLLGDNMCILAAPGRLLCHGPPVTLKTDLGQGYVLHVTPNQSTSPQEINTKLNIFLSQNVPQSFIENTHSGSNIIKVRLNCKDTTTVTNVLTLLRDQKDDLGIESFDVEGSTLEEVFLKLMREHGGFKNILGDADHEVDHLLNENSTDDNNDSNKPNSKPQQDVEDDMDLATATSINVWEQAWTILRKRFLIAKRGWAVYLLPIILALAASGIPLFFMEDRTDSCIPELRLETPAHLSFSQSEFGIRARTNESFHVLVSPPDGLTSLGINDSLVNPVLSRSEFIDQVRNNHRSMEFGGISLPTNSSSGGGDDESPLLAYNLEDNQMTGTTLLNTISNHYLQESGSSVTIEPHFQGLPRRSFVSIGQALKWLMFFALGMGVFPAFSVLYPTGERRTLVKAMQLSNGATPLGLWIGHLLFETPCVILIATLVTVVFAAGSEQFNGVGLVWLCLVLYGWASTLFSFVISLFAETQLAAFALVAAYHVIMVMLFISGQLLVLTYALSADSANLLTILYFTMSLLTPVNCVARMAFVSINLFALLCEGQSGYVSNYGGMLQFGGVIVYLIGWIIILFIFLVWYDSGGSQTFWKATKFLRRNRTKNVKSTSQQEKPGHRSSSLSASSDNSGENEEEKDHDYYNDDTAAAVTPVDANVLEEVQRVQNSQDNLRVLNISKAFSPTMVALENVSFGVSSSECFALIGPNGAGKTTMYNCIRGELSPDSGDAFIEGNSISRNRNAARTALGVCPQFDAIDKLTVREQLTVYAHLKGIPKKKLVSNVEAIMQRTGLTGYADRFGRKLSGGNQRKLSLAISLLGSPSVLLVDEFSSGMDPATKRVMWDTLRAVQQGRALVITTHSMEETEALASRVGIIARRMLTVASPTQLRLGSGTYELHVLTRDQTPAVTERIRQFVVQNFPGAKKADDVATRFEIPITSTAHEEIAAATNDDDFVHVQKDNNNNNNSNGIGHQLPNLFETMEREAQSLGIEQWHIAPVGLESIFIRKVKQHKVQEEDR